MRRHLLACLFAATAFPAFAEPVTYACRYTSAPSASEFAVVDQIIIDHAAKTIELRDANTIGTSHPLNWIFKDAGHADDTVHWTEKGADIAVSGTRYGMPYIFGSTGPLFGLSFADGLPFIYHEWKCSR